MPPRFDLLLRGGVAVLPWGLEQTDIGVRNGRIAALGVPAAADAAAAIDAAGLHVLPGLIDPHVHLRDPGDPAIETMATGTMGAVLGGVCAVFDMPNTAPPMIDSASYDNKRAAVEREAWCDVGLYVGATKGNIEALARLERFYGVCAIKVFAGSSTGDLLVEDDASIERVLRSGTRRIAFHSEDEYRLRERRSLYKRGDPYANHMLWRDEECAFLGTRRIVGLAQTTGRPVHILHVSTAEELDYLGEHRAESTVEVLVNHLTQMAPDVYEKLGGFGVMNPPIRDRRHWEASWRAVQDGRVDTVGSDHAPHDPEKKKLPWPDCPAGLPGVQTIVPIMLDHVRAGRLSLMRLADLMCAGPARVYGARTKGRIACGYDADFTLVDLGRRARIENSALASPSGWTPFDGMHVTGWPVATIVRGRVVMRDGAMLGRPAGQLVRFH
ncbi:MAG: dihydroorotase [Acetobacteraceae bacterium]|nr:dihydroorotase [Acetobacteraceae bacterium]